jgi:SH3-like domain-containing protein
VAIAEKDVVMEIQFCEKEWCKLASDEVKGWALRSSFWGMLEGEVLN